jgi:membrane protein DedA with SNARE-associated domain
MPFGRFSVYTFAGCLPWTFALAGVGYALGSRWTTVEQYLRPISILVAVLILAALAWWLVRRARAKRREESSPPEETPVP